MPPMRRLARLLLLTLSFTFIVANGSGVLPTQAALLSQHSPITPYPILFVTQPPIAQGFGGLVTTFGNHQATLSNVGRGGDLWIRYPDGALKNLTAAGYGTASGLQAGANAIAVREPAVHWSGAKAIFSMIMGAPTKQYDYAWQNVRWQLYEITGLGQNETPVITKVPNQPIAYNNISPTYGSDGRIIFTDDRRPLIAHHRQALQSSVASRQSPVVGRQSSVVSRRSSVVGRQSSVVFSMPLPSAFANWPPIRLQ